MFPGGLSVFGDTLAFSGFSKTIFIEHKLPPAVTGGSLLRQVLGPLSSHSELTPHWDPSVSQIVLWCEELAGAQHALETMTMVTLCGRCFRGWLAPAGPIPTGLQSYSPHAQLPSPGNCVKVTGGSGVGGCTLGTLVKEGKVSLGSQEWWQGWGDSR